MALSTNLAPRQDEAPLPAPGGASRVADANINPLTGLATDYLNHFNEAIMLLEMMADMPECREDFFGWQPRSYREHFAASNFKHRDTAIAAYEAADTAVRQRFESLADTMNEILLATREVMRQDLAFSTAGAIASLAVRWVKPLVGRAGAIVNGTETARHVEPEAAPQASVDALMAR
jgi:hypothetical protein